MPYKLGPHSQGELKGVHPNLVAVVRLALKKIYENDGPDFTVQDGLRTDEEQTEYIRTGASHVKRSKHQRQDDGYGHAVDLVPYIAGKLRWELPPTLQIASAMREAAEELNTPIRWGGSWERLDDDTRDPDLMVEEYIAKRRRQGRRPFVDAFHFELAA